ncbi:lipopolysaccharide biosynthesis protein [Holdemanella biformis]
MGNNTKKNVIWNMIGTTANAFNSLFFMIIVTRINGLKDSGVFTLAFSLACLFCFIGNYEGRVFQVTDVKQDFSNKEYIVHRISSCILMMVTVLIYCLIMKYDAYKMSITFALCFMKCCEVFSDVFYGVLQKNDNLELVGKSLFFKSIASIVVFIVLDLITKNLLLSCIGLDLIWLVVLFLYDIPKTKKLIQKEEKISLTNIIKLYKDGFFSFSILFLAVYLVNAQKYALDGIVAESLQAIFGIVLMPATIISLACQYLLQPILNTIANLYALGQKKEFNILIFKSSLLVLAFGFACVIGAYLLGIPVLNILYGVDISDYKLCLILIIVGAIFYSLSTLVSAALTTIRHTFVQFIVYSLTSLFALFVSKLFIIKFSLIGASFAYLLCMFIQFLLYLLIYIYIMRKQEFKEV